MIRRGLQFFAVLVLLGAAPCLAQVYVLQTPAALTLQDFTNSTFNGFYTQVGQVQTTLASVSLTYQRFSTDPSNGRWVAFLRNTATGQWNVSIYTNYPVQDHTVGRVTRSIDYVTSSNTVPPLSVSAFYNVPGSVSSTPTAGTAVFTWNAADAEMQQAFPDWASAGVKIPLGFTFAMSFWAAAVALSIGMKWVRDLASAAS